MGALPPNPRPRRKNFQLPWLKVQDIAGNYLVCYTLITKKKELSHCQWRWVVDILYYVEVMFIISAFFLQLEHLLIFKGKFSKKK